MKKYEWDYIVERTYVPMSASMTIFATSKRYFDIFLPVKLGDYGSYHNHFVFSPRNARAVIAESQINEFKKHGISFFKKMAALCRKEGASLLDDAKKYSVLSYEKMDNEEIASHFERFTNANHRFSVFIYYPLSLEQFLTEKINEIISRRQSIISGEMSHVKAELLEPLTLNESQKEAESFTQLFKAFLSVKNIVRFKDMKPEEALRIIQHEYKDLYEKISEHLSHFSWLGMRWFSGKPTTELQIVKRLLHNAEINSYAIPFRKQTSVKKRTEEIIATCGIDKSGAELIWLVKEYVFLRTFRTDVFNQSLSRMIPLLMESAARLSLLFDDVIMMSSHELATCLRQGKILPHIDFEERRKSWTLLREGDCLTIFQGKEADEFAKEQGFFELLPTVTNEVFGVTAYRGKVTGLVKIVRTSDDLSKVKKGDVLVAVMTFPSFTPAMEKASAFVTDEGGILCHASIVSREMKKPCIIGTKIATKVLKDGDMVEVDADRGIVKILQST